ncbi:hypothetical protein [Rahnella aceris]|uniref:Uncharacterized protein n=1 Tax=Rahnella sp. (strain Y9602) TaxID=2703885 RepID=A0ABW6CEZ3_RAHSY
MTKIILSNRQTRVKTGDWKNNDSGLPYIGKYRVGCFTLSYDFMVQYMNLIHSTPTVINSDQCNTSNENTVTYMQHYGIIDNRILLNMREMVKRPQDGFIVVQEKNLVTGIYRDNAHE